MTEDEKATLAAALEKYGVNLDDIGQQWRAYEAARSLTITIPGEPCAQGRPRAVRMGAAVRVIDPARSRLWKGVAQIHYLEALRARGFSAPAFADAVQVRIVAIFTLPKSHHRRILPVTRRIKTNKPDCDNLAKAALDAGNGILWLDDSQVARLTVEKFVGAQEEAPHLLIEVAPL